MKKRVFILASLLSLTLIGCSTNKEVEVESSVEVSAPVETATPEPTVEPTPTPTVKPTATPVPTEQPIAKAPTVTETPAAGEVVGEDPLAEFSDEELQNIFDQVTGGGNSNSDAGDGGFYFENNPDTEGSQDLSQIDFD